MEGNCRPNLLGPSTASALAGLPFRPRPAPPRQRTPRGTEPTSKIFLSLVRAHQARAKVHQSIGWTDLSVTNLVISSSKKECWLASNSLRETFAFTRPMVLPVKNSTDLIEI